MAFLITAGVTVPVALGQSASSPDEIGDRARAFDGAMLSTIRDRKEQWRIQTTPMPRADANTLRAALEGTPPLACSGDLLGGAVNCHAVVTAARYRKFGDGERVVLEFTLSEA